jgi:hypothetical protein
MKMLEVVPKIEINHQELYWKIRSKGTREVVHELERLWYATKDAVDYGWDNVEIKVSSTYGQLFAVQFSEHDDYISMTVWNERGGVSLGRFTLLENEFALGEYKRFQEMMNDWFSGFMLCAKCGKRINYYEKRHQSYFAGVFCDECWEGGVKQQEANESYN